MLWSEGRWVEIEARVIVLGRCKIDRSNTDDEKEEYVFHTLSGKPIRRLKVVLEPAQLLSYSEALKGAFNLEAFERLAIGRACEDDELAWREGLQLSGHRVCPVRALLPGQVLEGMVVARNDVVRMQQVVFSGEDEPAVWAMPFHPCSGHAKQG